MVLPSPETPKSERTALLQDMLDRNRKVCQELKQAVEDCIAKAAESDQEETQPSG